ncbi:hypothetical protein NDJ15_07570 [Vibrio parahaemolyticus]|uniref:hypothetical protein n=1 Tax=Vibrio TaxID=662 RepID=UPI00111D1524|nr:hypothetical protein [Vibrio parahaemolyticus]EGR3133956.1 hypothetical protein [Vibrio parahaemolyticus]EGR3156539.1 hypothetical protein [Vibrio parahaemolyticus]EHY8867361.1 hypothetical protein [Vibrio parahaemolyticus]EII3130682.1 hypothetical protein [Vibrio parahaemolyticus]EJG1506525.1 hypothetical protein [Vibrio parahaemolyticus]
MSKYRALWAMFGAVVLVQVALGAVMYFELPNWDARNSFGGMFGVVNTLFSGLAFCGVIYAIVLQSKELELQRQELKLTRDELSNHRGELSRAAKAQTEQAQLMHHAAKINATSTRLEIATTMYINNRNIPKGYSMNESHNSRDVMVDAYKELDRLYKENV